VARNRRQLARFQIEPANAMVQNFADIERAIGTDLDAERLADVRLQRRTTIAIVLSLAGAGDGIDRRSEATGGEKEQCEGHRNSTHGSPLLFYAKAQRRKDAEGCRRQ